MVTKWVLSGIVTTAMLAGSASAEGAGGTNVAPRTSATAARAAATKVAQATPQELGSANSIITLEPPAVSPYVFSAERNDRGVVLRGSVPDDATRTRLTASGADGAALELARGAPSSFAAAVDFGLAALERMSAGSFTLTDKALVVKGRAATADDYAALAYEAAPAGITLSAEIRPPVADPFIWSASRAADGTIAITGYIPDDAARTAIDAAAGKTVKDDAAIADGAPPRFVDAATQGLALLAPLQSGNLTFDGKKWSLEGVAATPLDAFSADSAFAKSGLKAAGWTYAVRVAPAPPATPVPVVADYEFRIERLPAGTVAISGHVPSDGLRRLLAARASGKVVDTTKLGSGAPPEFPTAALAGLAALQALGEGVLEYRNGAWSLGGRTTDPAAPDAVRTTLSAATDISGWTFDIKAPPPPPPVADPYTWSVSKAADGRYTLAGNIPSEAFRKYAAATLKTVADDTTEVARGAPEGFVTDALAGFAALGQLAEGSVSYDGKAWSLTGTPQTAGEASAAEAALATASTPPADWTVAIAAPPALETPAAAEPAPAVVASEPAAPTPGPGATTAVDAANALAAVPAVEPPASEPAQVASTPEAAAPESAPAATAGPAAAPSQEVATVTPTPAPAVPAVAAPPGGSIFDAVRGADGTMSLAGVVPGRETADYLGGVAGGAATDGLKVAGNLPSSFVANAGAGIRALMHLADGKVGFDGTRWSLTGTAVTEAERTAALSGLASLPDWTTSLSLGAPLDACRSEVAGFSARNGILFQSGKAAMTPASAKALDELAGYLGQCPDAVVSVEGHTDADGPEDMNLALSVARAEAVVDALVALGVSPDRLYAIGYGESLPIASNNTAAGKAANRRIVFSVAAPTK